MKINQIETDSLILSLCKIIHFQIEIRFSVFCTFCIANSDIFPIHFPVHFGVFTVLWTDTTCNKSAYVDQCPLFFFEHLQDYAKCSCLALTNWDAQSESNDSYLYFGEMTAIVESIFAKFRGKNQEDCPEWQFSCNSKGESLLNVFEIRCPLELEEDSDWESLKDAVDDGVESMTSDQVEIFGEYIRVLMYSEEEAMEAFEWMSSNDSDGAPEEIGSPCTMNETIWNLNEIYGDYVASEDEESTDNCIVLEWSLSLIITFLLTIV